MIGYRPCGACRALVPPAGCQHWSRKDAPVDPALAAKRAKGAAERRRARANARAAVEEFKRVMTPRTAP